MAATKIISKKRKVKIILDPIGDTLNIWWDDPEKTFISEESAGKDLDVLVKDKKGNIIGFERIGFFPKEVDPLKQFSREWETFYLGSRSITGTSSKQK